MTVSVPPFLPGQYYGLVAGIFPQGSGCLLQSRQVRDPAEPADRLVRANGSSRC
jgi:hypothetical protein